MSRVERALWGMDAAAGNKQSRGFPYSIAHDLRASLVCHADAIRRHSPIHGWEANRARQRLEHELAVRGNDV